MPSTDPLISIVVLNWDGLAYLPACLAALGQQTERDFELLLVENGSHDGSAAYLAQAGLFARLGFAAEQVRVLHTPTNLGFAGGNNLAFASARGTWIATLNNDTVADPKWLAALLAATVGQPAAVGMIAGALLFYRRPQLLASAGLALYQDGLALDRLAGQPYQAGGLPYEVFGPSAGAALYSRKLLQDVGYFAPNYFAYLEDVDLAWRARLRGWRCLYAPGAAVLHHYSATGKQGSPFKSYQLARNRLWTIARDFPSSLLRRHLPSILAYDALALAYGLAKGDSALVRGRLAALHSLPAVLKQRARIQSGRVAGIEGQLEGWLRPPLGVSGNLRQRRLADELAV